MQEMARELEMAREPSLTVLKIQSNVKK